MSRMPSRASIVSTAGSTSRNSLPNARRVLMPSALSRRYSVASAPSGSRSVYWNSGMCGTSSCWMWGRIHGRAAAGC